MSRDKSEEVAGLYEMTEPNSLLALRISLGLTFDSMGVSSAPMQALMLLRFASQIMEADKHDSKECEEIRKAKGKEGACPHCQMKPEFFDPVADNLSEEVDAFIDKMADYLIALDACDCETCRADAKDEEDRQRLAAQKEKADLN